MLSSPITIELSSSKAYIRFLIIIYLITLYFLFYSSLPLFLKFIITVGVLIQFKFDVARKSPCADIKEIRLLKNAWSVVPKSGEIQVYDKCIILIHNSLFQLIRLTGSEKKKIIILFYDQLHKDHQRLLYLKQTKNGL